MKEKSVSRKNRNECCTDIKKEKGITIIALVITIVLNCSFLAMV